MTPMEQIARTIRVIRFIRVICDKALSQGSNLPANIRPIRVIRALLWRSKHTFQTC